MTDGFRGSFRSLSRDAEPFPTFADADVLVLDVSENVFASGASNPFSSVRFFSRKLPYPRILSPTSSGSRICRAKSLLTPSSMASTHRPEVARHHSWSELRPLSNFAHRITLRRKDSTLRATSSGQWRNMSMTFKRMSFAWSIVLGIQIPEAVNKLLVKLSCKL